MTTSAVASPSRGGAAATSPSAESASPSHQLRSEPGRGREVSQMVTRTGPPVGWLGRPMVRLATTRGSIGSVSFDPARTPVIVDGLRTPFGRYGGVLKDV